MKTKAKQMRDEFQCFWAVANLTGAVGAYVGLLDPLMYLLIHSDCDGVIKPEHGAPLADRLEELLPFVEDKQRTEQFIAGLREAAQADEDVEFG